MHQAYFVYKIVCRTNGKVYIGATKDPANRWKKHRHEARLNRYNTILYRAMKKYGVDEFEIVVLFGSRDRDYIFNEMEPFFIEQYNSTDHKNGYNMSKGGEGSSHPTSEKTKKTLSEISKAVWASKSPEEMTEFKEKMKAVGADISEETRQKRSAAAKIQHADTEKELQMKAALITAGQDPERRKAISERAKARWADTVFRTKMQAKYATPEQREKKRNASLTRWAATTS
jgi:group I intron endonuclease